MRRVAADNFAFCFFVGCKDLLTAVSYIGVCKFFFCGVSPLPVPPFAIFMGCKDLLTAISYIGVCKFFFAAWRRSRFRLLLFCEMQRLANGGIIYWRVQILFCGVAPLPVPPFAIFVGCKDLLTAVSYIGVCKFFFAAWRRSSCNVSVLQNKNSSLRKQRGCFYMCYSV